jgi:hypothetical protein
VPADGVQIKREHRRRGRGGGPAPVASWFAWRDGHGSGHVQRVAGPRTRAEPEADCEDRRDGDDQKKRFDFIHLR